jgi:hypothetical protein
MGVSVQACYRWKKQDGGLGVLENKRLKLLEQENRRLKRLVADVSLGQSHAAGRTRKKTLRPARRPELAHYLETTYRVSERRGCGVLRTNRSGHRYRTIRHDQAVPRGRIRESAAARVRYGYFRIYLVRGARA